MVQQQEQLRLLPPGRAQNGILYSYIYIPLYSHGGFWVRGFPAVHWLLQGLGVTSPLPDCDAGP